MDIFNKQKITQLNKEIEIKDIKIKNLESRNNFLEKMYNNVSHNDELLTAEYRKMIEWVQKIIEAFDVFEVSNNNSVRIPIYKPVSRMSRFLDNDQVMTSKKRIIVVPEMIIEKYEQQVGTNNE